MSLYPIVIPLFPHSDSFAFYVKQNASPDMRLIKYIHTLMTLLLPRYTHSLTTPISNHTYPLSAEGDIECIPKRSPWYSRKVPTYVDCKIAVGCLPNFLGFGVFRK